MNPWHVESIMAFNYFCCPECVYRSKEESSFQAHALQNHPQSSSLFFGFDQVKEEIIEPQIELIEDEKIEKVEEIYCEKKKYSCLSCGEEFPKKSLMTKHMNSAHDKFTCDECGKDFSDHKQLIKHKYLHNQVQCEICHKSISRAILKRHMNTVHVGKEVRSFACDQCPYTAHAQRYLNEHLKLFHDPSKHSKEWRPHKIPVKTEEEFETCSECNQPVRKGKLVVHYKRSHGTLPPGYESGTFMCDQCPAELRSKKSLLNHIKVVHDEDKPLKYTCHECQLDFSGSRYLICHYKKVHGEIPPEFRDQKQYLCDQCPDVFLTKHSLHLHTLRKHPNENDKPIPKRVYKKKDKISKCPHCEKTFRCDRNLKEHIKVVHEKVTPFECDQCTRKFGLKRTLHSHKQIVHAKVNCEECGQEIYNSFELKRHKASVHGIVPSNVFHCQHCPLFFRSEKNLSYHIANKHQ